MGKIIPMQGTIITEAPLANFFLGIGGAKSVSLFLRLYVLCLSLLNSNASLRLGAVWPFRIL